MQLMIQLKQLGDALTDKSSLGKLRDCYQLNIFTIKNALSLFYQSNKDDFLYVLMFAMGNESLLNLNISLKIRAFFLETLLHIFQIYLNHANCVHSLFIGFNKSDKKPYVFFASPTKLRRMIITVFVQLLYVKSGNLFIGLNRAGSHDEENFIGIIRMLCNGDNSYERITHNLARYEYISRESSVIFFKPKAKRLNAGGCQIVDKGFDIDFHFTPIELANTLLTIPFGVIRTHRPNKEKIILEFISNLEEIMINAPYRTRNVPAKTSNATILNRLISFGMGASEKNNQKAFSAEETRIVDSLLLSRSPIDLNQYPIMHKCDVTVIQKYIDLRIEILSKRIWTTIEDNYIVFLIQY